MLNTCLCIYIQCMANACSVHGQYMYSAWPIHVQCKGNSYTVHEFHMHIQVDTYKTQTMFVVYVLVPLTVYMQLFKLSSFLSSQL